MANQHVEKRFWIQCENCKLYLDSNEQCFMNILHKYPGPTYGTTNWVCDSCKEKNTLLAELTHMNETVSQLNKIILVLNGRIDSLQSIHNMENELDETIDNLTAQMSALHVSYNHFDNTKTSTDTAASIPPVAVTVEVSPNDTNYTQSTINMNNTSVWSESTADQTDQQTVTGINKTYSGHYTLDDIDSSSNFETVHSPLDRPVKTLLVGDSVLRNVNLLGALANKNECLKIARKNASLVELIDTIKFFMNKVYKNSISTVVLQTCMRDIRHGSTELIINIFEDMIAEMAAKGINFIILGPIPLPNLSSVSFSRACCINDWLAKRAAASQDVIFVDTFDHYWKNVNQFTRNSYLNEAGQLNLAKFITEKFPFTDNN